MAAVTNCRGSGTQNIKVCHSLHCFPIYLSCNYGTRCHELSFLNVSFKPTLSYFTFIKKLFSSYSLSAIRALSPAYQKLFIFLPEILIPASASSTPTFLTMYSACKLHKHNDNMLMQMDQNLVIRSQR